MQIWKSKKKKIYLLDPDGTHFIPIHQKTNMVEWW